MKWIFNLLIALSLVTVSCTSGPEEKPNSGGSTEGSGDGGSTEAVFEILGLENNATLDGFGEEKTIQIKASSKWGLTTDCDWITFSQEMGEACDDEPINITINFGFNLVDERTATIKLIDVYKGNNVSLSVKQPRAAFPVGKYKIGDPEVTFDESKFDANYIYNPQMEIWRTAGVEGGIPHLEDQLAKVTKTFEAGTPISEIDDYFEENKYKEIVVLLKNGDYLLDRCIRLYSNATLIGESRDGVKITIDPNIPEAKAFTTYGAENVGIRNLWINGGWVNEDGENTPKYDWNEEIAGRGGDRTIDLSCKKNCFLDNVKITNSASHPIWTSGEHITIRDVEINGAFNKSGGCQGYFFIMSSKALITGCKITRIRHISFQNPASTQNVFFRNDLRQEITFHANDGGDNLIQENFVYLPPTMPDSYNAIMGPWSTAHTVGGLNQIYKNRCIEDNPGRGGKRPWSDDQLYLGPHVVSVGTDNPTRYTNFAPVPEADFPPHGTLYPVVLD